MLNLSDIKRVRKQKEEGLVVSYAAGIVDLDLYADNEDNGKHAAGAVTAADAAGEHEGGLPAAESSLHPHPHHPAPSTADTAL